MAFDFTYLGRLSQSDNVDKTINTRDGQAAGGQTTMWTYNGTDSGSDEALATIVAADYFQSAWASLNVGDGIFVSANDVTAALVFVATSAAGGITVTDITTA
jgi:hypothetical protein